MLKSELELSAAELLCQDMKWQEAFPGGMPQVWLSSATLGRLRDAGLIFTECSSLGRKLQFRNTHQQAAPKGRIQSWIFTSTCGRHGQGDQSGGSQCNTSPQMLIDWSAAVTADVTYVRVLTVSEDEAEVKPTTCDQQLSNMLQCLDPEH